MAVRAAIESMNGARFVRDTLGAGGESGLCVRLPLDGAH